MYTSGSVNFKNSNGEIDNYEGWKKEPDEDPSINHGSQDLFRALDDDILRKEGEAKAAAWAKEHPYTIEDYMKDQTRKYYKAVKNDNPYFMSDFKKIADTIIEDVPEDSKLITNIINNFDEHKGYTSYKGLVGAARDAINNGTSQATVMFGKMAQKEAYRIYQEIQKFMHNKPVAESNKVIDRLCESIYKESN